MKISNVPAKDAVEFIKKEPIAMIAVPIKQTNIG